MFLSQVWHDHFPGHRFSNNEGMVADALSTKGRESESELQAFKFSMLRDPPSKENQNHRKRASRNAASEAKRPCVQEAAPPLALLPVVVVEPQVLPNAIKIVRTLPPFLKPSAAALALFDEKHYNDIMEIVKKKAEAKKE